MPVLFFPKGNRNLCGNETMISISREWCRHIITVSHWWTHAHAHNEPVNLTMYTFLKCVFLGKCNEKYKGKSETSTDCCGCFNDCFVCTSVLCLCISFIQIYLYHMDRSAIGFARSSNDKKWSFIQLLFGILRREVRDEDESQQRARSLTQEKSVLRLDSPREGVGGVCRGSICTCTCPHLRLCPRRRRRRLRVTVLYVNLVSPSAGQMEDVLVEFWPAVLILKRLCVSRLSCAQILFDQAQRSIKQQLHTFIKE